MVRMEMAEAGVTAGAASELSIPAAGGVAAVATLAAAAAAAAAVTKTTVRSGTASLLPILTRPL